MGQWGVSGGGGGRLEETLMSCRKRGAGKKWKEKDADGGFGPREDASKEHLSQRPAGSLIKECVLVCVCVCLKGAEWKGCISRDR